jgi:hypothetical protein
MRETKNLPVKSNKSPYFIRRPHPGNRERAQLQKLKAGRRTSHADKENPACAHSAHKRVSQRHASALPANRRNTKRNNSGHLSISNEDRWKA